MTDEVVAGLQLTGELGCLILELDRGKRRTGRIPAPRVEHDFEPVRERPLLCERHRGVSDAPVDEHESSHEPGVYSA
jgi:hypothetical protein